ncbi:unnamed protein product [Choristocarpus tenellus]
MLNVMSTAHVPDSYLSEGTPAMPVMRRDWAFCRWMAIEHGLVAIPTSAFFSAESRDSGIGENLVRFCFCKKDETLDAAAQALASMARAQEQHQEPHLVNALGGQWEASGSPR